MEVSNLCQQSSEITTSDGNEDGETTDMLHNQECLSSTASLTPYSALVVSYQMNLP